MSPCLFNLYAQYIMQNARLDETQAGIRIVRRNISNLKYADDTTLMAEREEEHSSFHLMNVKEDSEKVGLKLNIQRPKIMAYSPIISWQIDGETMEKMTDFTFLGFKITVDGDCSYETKRLLLHGRKTMTNLDSVLKNRDIALLRNVLIVKAVVSSVVMYVCDSWTIEKAECRRINAFEVWYWRRLSIVPWTAISNQSILKEISPEYSLERQMLKLKLQYFGNLMGKAGSMEKTLMLEQIEDMKGIGLQRIIWLDGIIDLIGMSLSQFCERVKDREV